MTDQKKGRQQGDNCSTKQGLMHFIGTMMKCLQTLSKLEVRTRMKSNYFG